MTRAELHAPREGQMVRRHTGEGRGVYGEIHDKSGWPTQNPIKRENGSPRRETQGRCAPAKCWFENGKRGAPPPPPFVEIPHQNGRHWLHIAMRLQERAGLIEARLPKQPEMSRDHAKLALAEIQLGDNRAARLEARQA